MRHRDLVLGVSLFVLGAFVHGCKKNDHKDAGPDGDSKVDGGRDADTRDGDPPDVPVSGLIVWTQHNDNARTGANLSETVLTTANVRQGQFGLLFSRPVVGHIYGQPLYVPNLEIPGAGTHNVVFVTTEHNNVYAFDADDPAASTPLWQVNLGPSVPAEDVSGGWGCRDMWPEIGITSTPVIDLATGTLYVEAKTKEFGDYIHRLHALDMRTGQQRAGSPVVIRAQIAGGPNGDGSHGGIIRFQPRWQLNRPALLLLNGMIYLAFGSHCDEGPYHGWVLVYDAATLEQRAVYNATRNGLAAGIWQSGQGLTADRDGDVYLITGNGTYGANYSPPDLGDSFVRLHLSGNHLEAVDWFTPFNAEALEATDLDLGSTGVMLIPGTDLLIGAGKEGVAYVLDRNNMGRFNANDDSQIHQWFLAVDRRGHGNTHGTPVYWNGPSGPMLYVWSEQNHLMAFRFDGSRVVVPAAAESPMRAPDGMPGGMLSLSANGNRAGTGLLWATLPLIGDANHMIVPGVMRVFDAEDVSRELWNSALDPRDDVGMVAKFTPPTVVNGKVYVGSFSDRLNVYGLLEGSGRGP